MQKEWDEAYDVAVVGVGTGVFAAIAAADARLTGLSTYVRTWDGWAYVASVIDLHSRAVVGFAIDDHMRTSLVTEPWTWR